LISEPARRRLGVALALAALVAAVALGFAYEQHRRNRVEARAQFEKGLATLELGDPQAARLAAGQFERATGFDPNFADAWAAMSRALVEAYEDERAEELLLRAEAAAGKALAVAPSSSSARVAVARVLRVRGRLEEAISTISSVIETSGADPESHRQLALVFDQLGERAKAEDQFLAAIAARPDSWIYWSDLGAFRLREGNLAGSRLAYLRADELAPASATIPRENLATLLYLEGEYSKALAAYEAVPGGVRDGNAASNLGTLYYFNGRFADAEGAFRRAIQLGPREPLFHRNLADTLLRLERPDEARVSYETALRLTDEILAANPGEATLRLQRTLYLARCARCSETMRALEAAESELPPSAELWHASARALALCGETTKALERLERAVALGYPAAPLADEDELASLRDLPGFARLLARGKSAASAR
jgi:Flp pilus assembly protein TadD